LWDSAVAAESEAVGAKTREAEEILGFIAAPEGGSKDGFKIGVYPLAMELPSGSRTGEAGDAGATRSDQYKFKQRNKRKCV
jgi:hypothetical protein